MKRKEFSHIKRVVIKVGTSTLTHSNGHININRLEHLCRTLSHLQNSGFEVCLVSSGAVGAGMGKLGIQEKPKYLPEKQACAAVGQLVLSHMYQKMFSEYSKTIAQILLTKDDIGIRKRFINARNTFNALLNKNIIPIVNENDAIVTDEIKVGDNDTLSALTASLIEADLLILLTDIDGLYSSNPSTNPEATLLSEVHKIDATIISMAGGEGSKFGTGGMATKIKAAQIATQYGVDTIIANGSHPEILIDILKGDPIGTIFYKNQNKLNLKKHWITYGSKKQGKIIIDSGAVTALNNHKSLLPIGIKQVLGNFHKNDTVYIENENSETVAIGISNYHAYEISQILGQHSHSIKSILGHHDFDEVIHIDNIYLLKGAENDSNAMS